jgi:ABC-2 type transport system ATP-binding protein
MRFDRRSVSVEMLIRSVADRYRVSDISIEEPELESIIRRIYLEGIDDATPAVSAPT